MDWFAAIDIYCERTGPEFWAEPLNALSNLSFILAAVWGWVEASKRDRTDLVIVVLIALAALIGLGSFLFHTFANAWSSLADVIPIWIFVALFVLVAIHRIGGVRPGRIGIGLAVTVGLVAILLAFGGDGSGSQTSTAPASDTHDHTTPANTLLNGSEQYLPAVLALLAFAALSHRKGHPIAPWVAAATGTFMVSLTLRTLDMHLCAVWPFGTHFLWHILNGLTIALLFQGLIRSPRALTANSG
ncbi:ceramidase domain-containing protein [uncultured Aliiroseovarius sp.]|uniref:ceramidase domain-containing protein n=1 Tax=uncultured Aliiroseovarius sp. TaxID=1658783 RepID=UPI0025946BE1|nr:ceramidase domain-containing protein [uncultured Aliiroseovarius sp.]